MEKDRNSRVLSIIALFIAILGVSLGFAAFTSQLNINAESEVNPNNKFSIVLSKASNSKLAGTIYASPSHSVEAGSLYQPGSEFYGADATIDSSDNYLTISGLKAYFTEPNQSIVYTFYAYNDGEMVGYLNDVIFSPAATKCTIPEGSDVTEGLMNAACDSINVKINVGGGDDYTETTNNINGKSIAKDHNHEIKVTISYAQNGALADGKFEVNLGSIRLKYETKD